MKFKFETQGTGTLLVYCLAENEVLDSLTMGMMSNNRIEGVLPVTFSQLDNDRYLKYNVSSKISLEQYFNGIINKKRLLNVMISIASAVLNAQEYMIEPVFFVLDRAYIFVDISTGAAQLVCLPVEQRIDSPVDLERFFKEMVLGVQFDVSENCDYVAKLLGYFNCNAMFSLEAFLSMLRRLEQGEKPSEVSFSAGNTYREATESKAEQPPAGEPQAFKAEQPPSGGSQMPKAGMPPAGEPQMPGAGTLPTGEPQTSETGMPPTGVPQTSKAGMASTGAPAAGGVYMQGVNIPGAAGSSQAPAKPKKEKGFSLFGKREGKTEKQPKQKNTKTGGVSLPGRSTATVPGAEGVIIPGTSMAANSSTSARKPGAEAAFGGIGASYEAPSYEKQKASFGGTVVLNAGNKSAGTVVLKEQNAPEQKIIPYVLRLKNGQKVFMSGDTIKIGSDVEYADFSIADNRAVSRSHADVRRRGENFVLVDNNSTNHTFIDGRMATPNEEIPLRDGVRFLLANEEFEFHLK